MPKYFKRLVQHKILSSVRFKVDLLWQSRFSSRYKLMQFYDFYSVIYNINLATANSLTFIYVEWQQGSLYHPEQHDTAYNL